MASVIAPLLVMGLAGCFAPQHPPSTGRAEHEELRSEIVQDTYHLFVRLPPEYDGQPDRHFPLVIQLDANLAPLNEFDVTAGFASALEKSGDIEPTIVVGIGYASDQVAQVSRFRDLFLPIENAEFKKAWGPMVPEGAAPQFYQFIRDELMPHLEATYRIAGAQGRALFGHSAGGAFAAYALTRYDDAPVFTSYVMASPSLFWDAGHLLSVWSQLGDPSRPLVLFAAAGQLEGPDEIVYFDEFTDRVRAAGRPNLTFESRKYQTDHIGSVSPSFRDGLSFVFSHGLRGEP